MSPRWIKLLVDGEAVAHAAAPTENHKMQLEQGTKTTVLHMYSYMHV